MALNLCSTSVSWSVMEQPKNKLGIDKNLAILIPSSISLMFWQYNASVSVLYTLPFYSCKNKSNLHIHTVDWAINFLLQHTN